MRNASRICALGCALLIVTGCSGPWLLLPGGALEGEVVSAPADWASLAPFGTVQLETDPEDPYSVNIAGMLVEGVPQINAGDTETRWVENMNANPDVRLRIHDAIYELRASRVLETRAIAAFGEEWMKQGSWARDPTQFEEVWIYRLDPR